MSPHSETPPPFRQGPPGGRQIAGCHDDENCFLLRSRPQEHAQERGQIQSGTDLEPGGRGHLSDDRPSIDGARQCKAVQKMSDCPVRAW
jgi:hypothetical protein